MRSDKPQAEPFQDWVCGEVLPAIRKHGMYATDVTIKNILEDPDNFIQMMQAYQRERKERMAAQKEVERLEAREQENQPKVIYADAVAGSSSSCLIGELAKMFADYALTLDSRYDSFVAEQELLARGAAADHHHLTGCRCGLP